MAKQETKHINKIIKTGGIISLFLLGFLTGGIISAQLSKCTYFDEDKAIQRIYWYNQHIGNEGTQLDFLWNSKLFFDKGNITLNEARHKLFWNNGQLNTQAEYVAKLLVKDICTSK